MAKVHDIIFCLNSTNIEGQGASAHTILSTMNPEYVPGLFSFSSIVTILDLDNNKEHKVKFCFGNDDEEKVVLEGKISSFDDPSNLPKEYKGVNLSVDWNNVNFRTEGIYKLLVSVDDVELDSKSIYVKGKNQ